MTPAAIALLAGLLGGGGLGAVIVALINAKSKGKGDLLGAVLNRLAQVEKELGEQREWRRAQENRYSVLWAYCRRLIDYAYKYRREGSPDLPEIPDELT